MSARSLGMATLLIFATLAGTASAEVSYTFKHDQFSDSLAAASQELSGMPLGIQSGFVAGEAFGVIFRPTADMYPVKIEGVDVITAAMPYDIENSKAHAMLEIYFFDGDGPDPENSPTFTLSTYDVFNEVIMDLGQPLMGNTGVAFEFDWAEAQGHPPMLQQGNFLVAVRFLQDSADLSEQWGSYQCAQMADLGMCGCQKVGTIHDQASTLSGNVLHIIYPPGNCDGAANKWVWFEDVGVTGDVILRARTKIQDAPCVPNCLDKECGDDSCSGSCGQCTGEGESCVNGKCVACEPSCDGKECGDDSCSGSCGDCADGETCNAQGICDVVCVPACDGKVCGDDGCDGSCGTCEAGLTCNASGQCVEGGVCDPVANCVGKNCGDDGCGGLCGVCEAGLDCVMGTCTEEGEDGEFTIKFVSPEEGCNDEATAITITGSGFVEGMTVTLSDQDGEKFLVAVVLDKTMIRATVPAGMKSGSYDLRVISPSDQSKFFPGAFKVIRCGSTGCGVGERASPAGLGLLLLLGGLVLAWRRVWA